MRSHKKSLPVGCRVRNLRTGKLGRLIAVYGDDYYCYFGDKPDRWAVTIYPYSQSVLQRVVGKLSLPEWTEYRDKLKPRGLSLGNSAHPVAINRAGGNT